LKTRKRRMRRRKGVNIWTFFFQLNGIRKINEEIKGKINPRKQFCHRG
jgi:hypothetical protein